MTEARQDELVLGIDIGGTKIAFGLVDAGGKIVSQGRKPMVARGSAEDGLKGVIDAIDSVISESVGKLRGIGICAPGPLDPRSGTILNPPNLPCWRDFPLAAEVRKHYSIPVKVDNDGNAAALAETKWGAAKGHRCVFYATVGTGIGSGIVLDGRIYHGNTGSAAEGGHVSIDYRGPRCNCGKLGCIETLAAGPAIGARARSKLADGSRRSMIRDSASGDVSSVTSEMVGRAFEAGDALAQEVLRETVGLLTVWLGNMVDLLDPDVLVMGGGVSALLRPFFNDIRSELPQWCVNPRCAEIPLLIAHYGADAGIAGGAALCANE